MPRLSLEGGARQGAVKPAIVGFEPIGSKPTQRKTSEDYDLHRRLSRLQCSSAYRRSRGHPLWPTRHDLCLRDRGDDPGRDDGRCGLALQGPAPAAAVSARASIADRPLEAAMSRHLALVTSKREARLKPRAEGIAWMRV